MRNKKQQKNPRGWQHTDPLGEEDINEEPTETQTELDYQTGQTYTQGEIAPTTHLGPHYTNLQQEPQMEISASNEPMDQRAQNWTKNFN